MSPIIKTFKKQERRHLRQHRVTFDLEINSFKIMLMVQCLVTDPPITFVASERGYDYIIST